MTSKGKRPPKRKEPEQIQQIQQIPQIQQIQQKQSYFNQNFLDEDFLNEGENEDDELYGLKNEINTIKENAFKIDENLKSKYQVISKKEQIERLIIEWDCVKENQINLNLIEKDNDYIQAIKFNFTGLEKSTDLIFYALIKYFKKHPKKGLIKFNEILVSCCKYISIWSLHYLSLANDKTILMLNSVPFNIRKRVAGCDRISDNMAVSLQFSNELHLKDENSLCNSSKVVIINEDTQNTFLIDYLINKNSEANNPTSFFKYSILKESNKVLNLFECCESLSNIFLTERNLTVITFNSSQSVDDVEKSVVRRLLKVMSKNILPIKVVILAIGSIDENKLGNYKNKIISYLSKLQIDIKSDVDKKLKLNGQDLSFQEQKKLSNDINLSEQIKLFLDMINFSSIDLENNNNPSFNRKVKNDKNIDELNQKLTLCLKEISSIKKNEIAEVKSMKMPPSACVQVMEAICIIFSKKPSIENFNKLVSDTQKPLLTDLIPNYDMNSISDYVKNNLKKYYENPDYNPNKVKMSSNYMSILCKWSRLVYEYGSSNPNWQESTNSSALKSFLFSNSFYMFPWPAYVDDLDSTVFEYVNGIDKNITYIDDLIKKLYLKESKVLTIDEYFDKFNQNKEIDSYMALNGFYSLPEKHAKSESAKGNFYFNEETKLIITDIEIISDIILFLTTKSKSNFYERVHKIVGENVPIVKLNDLNNFLTTKLSSSSIDRLITYLVDISLIKIIEYDSSKETNLIVPLFLLNENSINEIDSIDSKNELEYEMKLELFSSLPNDSFFKFIIHFFDINKTQSVWKYGLFNVDSGCDVILTCSQSAIKLSAKIFNSDSYGCEGLSDKYLKFIFYDYYFYLAYILDYNNVSYKIQKNEKTSLFIKEYYRESYLNYIAQKHNFNSINRCENCSCTNKEIKKLIKYDNYLNPSFEYIDKSNLISIYDGFTQSFNFEDQNKFEIKFPTDSNDYYYEPSIEITKKLSDKTVTIKYTIKLNERSLETYSYLKYENKIIEEKRETGLVNHDSYGNQVTWMKLVQAHNQYKQINIKSNDSFRIQIENGKEIELVAYLNMEKLLAIRLSNEMPILNLNAGFIFHSKYKNIKTKDDRRTFQPNVAHVLISNQNMYKKIDSCNNSSNLRNEYRRLKIYFENNLSKIVKSLKIYESGRDEGLRGVVLLPKKINELSTPNIPAKIPYSFDDFDYHMFCISYEEFRAAEEVQFVLHSHLIDVAGLPFNKSLIDKKFLVYLITSAYALSQAQNKYIFPKYEILLPKIAKEKMNTEQLDKTMRFYSYNLFQRLLICINLSDISGDLISLDIANFTKQIKSTQ